MPASLSDLEFQLFKRYIIEKCAIDISDDKAFLIETRLSKLLADTGVTSFNALYQLIASNKDPELAEKVIDAITTNETLWFRDLYPWLILEKQLLPQWISELRSGMKKKIYIWSAAASTGQEAYSTAMCIDSYLKRENIQDVRLDQFDIWATDISRSVLEIARRGRYDAISIMRGMDPTYKEKYFEKDKMVWVLDEKIKSRVRFEHFNLQNPFYFMNQLDLVFCRYVLIYFADAFKAEIMKKMFGCVQDGGNLFLGASEFYYCVDPYFEMKHYQNGTYYAKRRESL